MAERQFQGSSSSSLWTGCSAIRARTSASQACGSTSFILAVTMMLYMAAARCPPRSEPANNHDFRPKAMPRSALSAALFDRQIRPSSRKRVNAGQRLSTYSIALATSLPRESLARCSRIQPSRSATNGALSSCLTARRCSALWPLIERSISNRASMRRTASRAGGDLGHIRHDEERTAGMHPAGCFQDRPRFAIGLVQLVVSAVCVSLENPGVVGEMRLGMFARSVARVIEHCRRRRGAAERAIVAHINPTSAGVSFALRQDRYSGVITVQSFRREDMRFNTPEDRFQHRAAGSNLVG